MAARRKTRTRAKPISRQTSASRAAAGKSRRQSAKAPSVNPHVVGRIVGIAVAIAVVVWQWGNITAWAASVRDDTMRLFGLGLALLIVAIVSLSIVAGVRKQVPLMVRFRQWWGGIAFTIAIWTLLGYGSVGGSIGQYLIGFPSSWLGIPRIVGLVMLGIALVNPQAYVNAARRANAWTKREFARRPAPEPRPTYTPPPPLNVPLTPPPSTTVPQTPTMPPPPVMPPTPTATPTPAPTPVATPQVDEPAATAKPPEAAPTQEELRQVAQEVWKKYGESPGLITENGWRLPPIEILDSVPEMEFSQADNAQRARLIEEALASYGVEAKVVQINAGPTVTQFGVEPGWDRRTKQVRERDRDGNVSIRLEEVGKTRVKVDKITALANDLALALAAPSIRIEAPVPGKPIVGIEVPNTTLGMVNLRGVIETTTFQKLTTKTNLALALGKGAGGEAVVGDLAKMPHLLIAGATGSGKTVCLNTIICCLLLHNTPNSLRFIMVDPKRVELTPFNSIPHLAAPVIVDTDKALNTLRWLNTEMDKRYQQMAMVSARNIEAYNKKKEGEERIPYLVLVIDELADLMMAGSDEVEHILCRLAQLARATGIHLVVATQRPSVDVVTGLIKANFPTRISFAVTSQVDSRTILDTVGAEKLLGRGDMLYLPPEASKPKRIQGCYVSDPETERLVYFWGSQKQEEAATLKIDGVTAPVKEAEYPKDVLLETARELLKEHKHVSTSFLQRKLHIGYPRAARLMEQLEEEMETGGEGEE